MPTEPTPRRPRRWTRRDLLTTVGLAGGVGLGVAGGLGWRTLTGRGPRLRDPVASLDAWYRRGSGRPVCVALPPAGATPLSKALPEVLLTEGVNGLSVGRLDEVIREGLRADAVTVVAGGEPGPTAIDALAHHAAHGGRLVLVKPSVALAAAFGLECVPGWSDAGVVTWSGEGWPDRWASWPTRLLAPVNAYRGENVEAVATVRAVGSSESVTAVQSLGRYGGRVVVWSFDVSQAVVLARQGDPALVRGAGDFRPLDLLAGGLDLPTLDVPHADLHARALVTIIARLLTDVCPLPRVWYFEGGAPAQLVATGDAHQSPTSAIDDVLARVEGVGGTMSIYFEPPISSSPRRAYRSLRHRARDVWSLAWMTSRTEFLPRASDVARWRARGHEFGIHVDVDEGWDRGWDGAWRAFDALGWAPVPPTTRTHRVQWFGWSEAAAFQAARGIRLNTDYYHAGTVFRDVEGVWRNGFLNASGLAARFVDERGEVLDIVQQCTQLVDEHLMVPPWGSDGPGLSTEEAAAVSAATLDLALRSESPAALGLQCHVDPFAMDERWRAPFGAWLDATLEAAASRGVHVVSGERALAGVDARLATSFDDVHWDAALGRLAFDVRLSSRVAAGPTLWLPTGFAARRLTDVWVDGHHEWERGKAAVDARVPLPARDCRVEARYA